MAAEVSITVKGGPGYDEPWVTFKGTVDEVGEALADFRHKGLFGSVKAATAEFKAAPVTNGTQAVKALNQAGMDAQELPEHARPKCPECGADTYHNTAYSTKKKRSYEGDFCSQDKNHKPASFQWVS